MRSRFLENLRTLLAALVLGLLVWYIARNEMTGEEQVEAMVKVTAKGDCRVEGEDGRPPRVRVIITGPVLPLARVRDEILRGNLAARIRLAPEQEMTGGLLVLPVTESIFPPLGDPRVRLRLVQKEVRLKVTPIVRRRKPVRLDIPDLDPSRYRVRVLVPRDVTVRGPKALLDRLTEVKTEPLRLARVVQAGRRSFQANVEIATVIDGQRIECNERSVYVDIAFGEEIVERTLENLPVRVMAGAEFPYRVRIEPGQETATVTVWGPRSVVLDPQFEQQVLVFVEVGGLKPGTTPYLVERRCWVPRQVERVRISGPRRVSVDILERKAPGGAGSPGAAPGAAP